VGKLIGLRYLAGRDADITRVWCALSDSRRAIDGGFDGHSLSYVVAVPKSISSRQKQGKLVTKQFRAFLHN
jgi:hypothetical protein